MTMWYVLGANWLLELKNVMTGVADVVTFVPCVSDRLLPLPLISAKCVLPL